MRTLAKCIVMIYYYTELECIHCIPIGQKMCVHIYFVVLFTLISCNPKNNTILKLFSHNVTLPLTATHF